MGLYPVLPAGTGRPQCLDHSKVHFPTNVGVLHLHRPLIGAEIEGKTKQRGKPK